MYFYIHYFIDGLFIRILIALYKSISRLHRVGIIINILKLFLARVAVYILFFICTLLFVLSSYQACFTFDKAAILSNL